MKSYNEERNKRHPATIISMSLVVECQRKRKVFIHWMVVALESQSKNRIPRFLPKVSIAEKELGPRTRL